MDVADQKPTGGPCARHADERTTGHCLRCGDFVCPKCFVNQTGVCLACAELLEKRASTGTTRVARVVAIICAFGSGLILLAFLGLAAYLKVVGAGATWNSAIGLVYIAIGVGLWRRSPTGYSWSIGTQGLNSLLNGFYLFQALDQPAGGGRIVACVIIGTRLVFHVVGFIATRIAKPEFFPAVTLKA